MRARTELIVCLSRWVPYEFGRVEILLNNVIFACGMVKQIHVCMYVCTRIKIAHSLPELK